LQQAHRIEIKGESMRKRKKLQENNCNNYIYEPLFKYHSRGTLSCDSVVHFGRIIQVVSETARNKRAYFWNDKAAMGLQPYQFERLSKGKCRDGTDHDGL
jgi:hypothetical protein